MSGSRAATGPRAVIVGTGLIGGSIGLALRTRGWHVTGRDLDPARAERAVAVGALDATGDDPDADVTFVCTPVLTIAAEARAALAAGPGLVTDVGSVKGPVAAAVDDPRFVGGHPMAGSEQEGVDGADAGLFEGATWVLTPTLDTDPQVFARIRSIVTSLGADVVALPPERHDELVALVSHVPHLAAATLMALAADGADEHAAVLRLAAGGFRDMTRVAAGSPAIWPDICAENRDAIVGSLDRLVEALGGMRDLVASGDRSGLLVALERARAARMNLPGRVPVPEELAEVRVPVPDRPGVLAEVTTLLGELGVNIVDLEIAHSVEGPHGVLVMMVRGEAAEDVRAALADRGFRPWIRVLT
ncbi:MAG TPA: prephenate dehydrogenase/arogenate dehydrogenase family protein [Acidimicrobiales bacterium]|nr:prephenate dehydrogenase/arogenate dehydrogenase family protein [Acidimicrobiales bacterium]